MLLTISTTGNPRAGSDASAWPATDLGYLLFKHPDRVSEFPQSFGTAWVFFPEADEGRCTAALLLEIDPIKLAKAAGKRGTKLAMSDASLAQYVNDRSYAASSLLGVALARVFSTARSGRGGSHQELADQPIPLEINIPVLPARGGVDVVHRIFSPLGWEVEAKPIELDERFPEWGDSPYVDLTLRGDVKIADALNQLHVLLPVFDESKHYWQGDDEVDKLLRSGGGWLGGHPEREFITRRYLARSADLTRAALARLAELGDDLPTDLEVSEDEFGVEPINRLPLRVLRQQAVVAALRELGAKSVADLGCGSGALLAELLKEQTIDRVVGTDVSARALQSAANRLHLDEMSERQASRIDLFQSALTYEDPRLQGFDTAVLMEVIEHVDLERLPALERVVFGAARPGAVVVTTPNAEYNALYAGLDSAEIMRHSDHRFEWSRAEFADWASRVADEYGYDVQFRGVGQDHPAHGTPTQMAMFTMPNSPGVSTGSTTRNERGGK